MAEPERPAMLRCMHSVPVRRMAAPTWLEACIVLDNRDVIHVSARLGRFMREAEIDIVPFTDEMAGWAREAHQRFGKGRHPAALNYGDCISYGTARFYGEPLLYKGADFAHTDITPALA